MTCDLDKPLVTCTLRDFLEALSLPQYRQGQEEKTETTLNNMPKGMKGIMQIFGCSDYMARKIRNSGVIDKAIYQYGVRGFVTDAVEAKRLYKLNPIY